MSSINSILKEKDMEKIVELIDSVIINYNDKEIIKKIKNEVNEFMSSRPLFIAYRFQSQIFCPTFFP